MISQFYVLTSNSFNYLLDKVANNILKKIFLKRQLWPGGTNVNSVYEKEMNRT